MNVPVKAFLTLEEREILKYHPGLIDLGLMLGVPALETWGLLTVLADIMTPMTEEGTIPRSMEDCMLDAIGYVEDTYIGGELRTEAVWSQMLVQRDYLTGCAYSLRRLLPINASQLHYVPSRVQGLYHAQAVLLPYNPDAQLTVPIAWL